MTLSILLQGMNSENSVGCIMHFQSRSETTKGYHSKQFTEWAFPTTSQKIKEGRAMSP